MPSIERDLSGDVLHFALGEERERLTDSTLLASHGRNARTLLKMGPLRVTLVMMRAGGTIAPHRAAGPITVHVLDGDIAFHVADQVYRLSPGSLLAVEAGLEHSVASVAGGTFLLTVVHDGVQGDHQTAGNEQP